MFGRSGSAGPARLVRLGRSGSAGPARSGPVQLGPARSGSVRLGPARSGPGFLFGFLYRPRGSRGPSRSAENPSRRWNTSRIAISSFFLCFFLEFHPAEFLNSAIVYFAGPPFFLQCEVIFAEMKITTVNVKIGLIMKFRRILLKM